MDILFWNCKRGLRTSSDFRS